MELVGAAPLRRLRWETSVGFVAGEPAASAIAWPSHVEEDRAEAHAIRKVLADTPVTAMKSYFGNLGAGGAAVELGASVLSLSHNSVPASLNYEQPDPDCPINVVHGESLQGMGQVAIKLSRSGTGQTAAVVVEAM